MKLKTLLNEIVEGKQRGTLYHFTNLKNLNYILKSDSLRVSTEFERLGISTTRNKNFGDVANSQGLGLADGHSVNVRISLDGDKLSNKYKIVPTRDIEFFQDPEEDTDESEELIKTQSLPNLHKYVKSITVYEFSPYDDDIETIIKYYEKYNTPIKIMDEDSGKFSNIENYI